MEWTACLQAIEARNAPLHPHVPANDFHNSVLISPRYGYVYVNNPKVACTTIRKLLIDAEFGTIAPFAERAATLHYKEFLPFLTVWQVGDFPAFVAREDLYKFCFVRNPFTRLLSGYLDKVVRNKPEKRNILEFLGRAEEPEADISFATFIRAVCAMPVAQQDHHWRVQYYQTFQAGIAFDFVGRFERLEEDLRALAGRLGIAGFVDAATFGSAGSTSRRHATGADRQLTHYYTDELRDLVLTAYRADFQHFGYPRALPR